MEIIFITGKGGVGKSAVAAAYALRQSQTGKRTILVELGNQSFYQDYFETPPISYKPVNIRENLDFALWSGLECLKEYALYLLKIETLYRLFFENSVSRALINVAPGLSELSVLGKITSGPPRNVGPRLPYECVVVDAYASGHFISLLRAPRGMAEAVRFGPMGQQSRDITRVLSDPSICRYFVVSLPEELPVVEALELSEQIRRETGIRPINLMNKCLPLNDEILPAEKNLEDFSRYLQEFRQRQKKMENKFAENGFAIKKLPLVLKHQAWSIVSDMAQELADG
jgi:anion-transporting  ArsA/GET3 family ATPase